jgi:ABC-type glycerol-3-phosphate transport system substrate-binding protein
LAVAAKLVEQIDTSNLTTADFYPSGLALGQVNGIQYGIPYVLEVQQTVYRTTALPTPPRSLDDLVASGQNLLFPAGVIKGVNTTLLQQYIAAGGRIADDKGVPTLDVDPLRTVLHYYEQPTAFAGMQLLDYTSPIQYWPTFLSGKANLVQVDSTTYLAQRANLTNVGTMPILLPAAAPSISAVDGWLWVITTPDADRQAQALSLLTWLIRSDQEAAFTKAMGVLPSERSALATWGDDSYTTFAGTLLDQTTIPPQDMIDPSIANALQTAFAAVLSRQKTADLAANDAQASVGK